MRLLILIALLIHIPTLAISGAQETLEGTPIQIDQTFGRLPLYFIENQGQLDEEVAYYVQGSDKILYFTSQGVTMTLRGEKGDEAKRWSLKLDFLGTDPKKPKGKENHHAVISYFRGKHHDWHKGCPTYGKLIYEDLWPGIDLVYSGTKNLLKYVFIVDPGANPDAIRLAYRGVSELYVKESGALVVSTPAGSFEDGAPFAFQEVQGKKMEVPMRYKLLHEKEPNGIGYGFELGAFDPEKPLILDPAVLLYCGYIGGINNEACTDIAVDSHGQVYVTGWTTSDGLNDRFPVQVGPDMTYNGYMDAFVAKVNATGTELLYCGYIGGNNFEYGSGIAVDGQGQAYIVGNTQSNETSFPTKVGPDLQYNGGFSGDAFVAKVNASGTDLVYCGYIGGNQTDYGYDIALDSQGQVYITGETKSDEASFPVSVGPDLTFNGYNDAFVAKVNASGTDIMYCGYIGGNSDNQGLGIAVDSKGQAYVTGQTKSDETSFPVKGGPDLTYNGGYYGDAFVAKVNASGADLVYCGYIGGSDDDTGHGIALDSHGQAYITGETVSDETSFPVKGGPDLTFNGWNNGDAFVAKVNASGADLEYCGYIGGIDNDSGYAIAVDGQGQAYVTGNTRSSEANFPIKGGPDLTFNGGYEGDAFVAKVNASGADLAYCGYIGGSDDDFGYGIAVDRQEQIYVTGKTNSYYGFPIQAGPDLSYNYGSDAFVAKVLTRGLYCDKYYLIASTGGKVNFHLVAGNENANRSYFLLGGASGTVPGITFPSSVNLPLNWDALTAIIYQLANSKAFAFFNGILDSSGGAVATLDTLGPLPSYSDRVTLYFTYLLYNPVDFVSNPVGIKIYRP